MSQTETLLSTDVAVTGTPRLYQELNAFPFASIHAAIAGTGAVSGTFPIFVGNDLSLPLIIAGTISLSGTTTAQDGFSMMSRWKYMRADCTTILGTGATAKIIKAN